MSASRTGIVDVPEDLMANYFTTREGLIKRDVGPPAQRIMEVLLRASYLEGKTEAPIASLEMLANAAILHKGNLRRVLELLKRGDVITERVECEPHGRCIYYFEIKPDWQSWHVPRRHTIAEEAEAERALQLILEQPDPAQMELIERPADFGAEVSRAFSSASVVRGTTEPRENSQKVVRGTTGAAVVRGTTGPPHGGVVRGTTAPHEHEEHDVQNMVHDALCSGAEAEELKRCSTAQLEGRLDDERQHTWEQMHEVPELTAPKFRRTWLLRLLDRNYPAVVSAVGEARYKLKTGFKPRKGWGEFTNDLYHRSKDALRGVSRTLKALFFMA